MCVSNSQACSDFYTSLLIVYMPLLIVADFDMPLLSHLNNNDMLSDEKI